MSSRSGSACGPVLAETLRRRRAVPVSGPLWRVGSIICDILYSGPDTGTARLRRSVSASTGPQALPDLLLIERARAGESQAIEALMHRYSGRLYRVAYSVLLDAQRAEAVVLEAFLAAFGDLSRYEPTGKFAAWLTRLAYHQARAQRTAARAAQSAALAEPLNGGET